MCVSLPAGSKVVKIYADDKLSLVCENIYR